jgi:subtilisin family serine protease
MIFGFRKDFLRFEIFIFMKQKSKYYSFVVMVFSILFLMSLTSTNNLVLVYAVNYEDSFHHTHIESAGAWEITQGTKNITVAVIDSGIDFSHPDLVNAAWNNTDEIAGNGIDDDNNGFIDDVKGWDFVSNDSEPGPEGGDPIGAHGTVVAGIIAAPLDDDGVVGVAPNITIMDIRLLNSAGYGYGNINLSRSIQYAIDNGADVISLSIYWSMSEIYHTTIQAAVSQNIPVVSITGNDGQYVQIYPGGYEEVIAVGATDYYKNKADYSNFGPWTDIVAPVGDGGGIKIWSTYPGGGYVNTWTGTSFACPQVSAVIALMRSLNYSLTVAEIKDLLFRSATDLGDPGKDIYFGYGLLNASMAVRAVLDPGVIPPAIPELTVILAMFPVLMVITITTLIVKKRNNNK